MAAITDPSYSHGIYPTALIGETIGTNLREAATAFPGNEALVDVPSGRRWTYGQLDSDTDAVALGLLGLGVGQGDRVGIWAPNCAEWVLTQYATAKIGAILVNINPAYRSHELGYVLGQSGVRLLVSAESFKTSDYRAMVEEVRGGGGLDGLERVIYIGTQDWDDLVAAGSVTLADKLDQVRGQVSELAASVQELENTFKSSKDQYSGETLVHEVDLAAQLIDHVNVIGNDMGWNYTGAKNLFGWILPVVKALEGNPTCDLDESCSNTRGAFEQLLGGRDQEHLDAINDLAHQMQDYPDKKQLKASSDKMRAAIAKLTGVLKSLGMDQPGGLQGNLDQLQGGANQFAGGSRQIAEAVNLLVDQVKQLGAGLSESATFLLSLKKDAAQPSMGGFNIPAQLLHLQEFQDAAKVFISADGHSVRYLVQTKLNPFSTEAMDQVNAILATAKGAQPNTALSDAKVSMAGYTVGLKDTRDYYQHDIRFIIAVTLLVVLLTLIVLLRAIVAPLYLVASVVVSYLSAVGIGAVFFQFILGQQLHWSVPPLAFVVLVSVGADYNMLLVSRMRDESPHSTRYGIIRTLSSTGGVITAAGLIFAASMAGLLFSSIGTVVQGGVVIGVGILLDTFLVRTITVPAIAALMGRANWWPSRPDRSAAARTPAQAS